MKRSTILKLRQLKAILIAWAIMGFLMSVYDQLLLNSASAGANPIEYSFIASVIRNTGAGIIGALLGGSCMVFYINPRYQDKPYMYTIILVTAGFLLVVAMVSVLIGIVLVPMKTGRPISDPATFAAFKLFLADVSHVKAALAWSFVVAITQLLLQMNSKFGQADFWNILRGKYNQPKEEERIFMFLDINSSTAIAEQLGDEKYHALLKDFFADITSPILENNGNIYQYVGDEVVIAWDMEDGRKDFRCLRCFYDMKLAIEKKRSKYLQQYGLVPEFKGAVHCGRVVAGEVGIIKRDITYSGNVLNTTSRILGICGELKEEIIASAELLSQIGSLKNFITTPLGGMKLRGKEKHVMLNALKPVMG